MKKIIAIIFSAILSCLIVFGYPKLIKSFDGFSEQNTNEKSLISQEILYYDQEEHSYNKIYYDGKLIGVASDINYINKQVQNKLEIFSSDFPNCEMGLKSDVYITEEKGYNVFENIDDKIISFLDENDLIGIKVSSIEFSTQEGIYDIIYVDDIEKFYSARDSFLTNFVNEETLETLRNNGVIDDINDFGTIEKNIKIMETISYSSAIASPEEILTNEEDIYEYLCYGKSKERTYYTVQEGDTLSGIGYYFGDMSPKQIYSLNKDSLASVDQLLVPGTVLNVTYFSSPITVVVTKQRLSRETVTPEAPEYRQDDSMSAGKVDIIQNEVIGLQNMLYEETWINGVLQSGSLVSSSTIREAVRGVIAIGVMPSYKKGTGIFRWPTDSPYISCGWLGYPGHNGTDIQSRYNRYGNVYAADSGTVERVGYDDISGNYIIINHNNGYKTYYGHMNVPAFASKGDSIERGQLIGQIGMTGVASGPHIHFMIYVDEVIVDACTIMNCDEIQ